MLLSDQQNLSSLVAVDRSDRLREFIEMHMAPTSIPTC
jgi:hypothetical protein